MRWVGHVAHTGEMGGTRGTYWGEERCIKGFYGGNLGDLGVVERIILKLMFKKLDGEPCIWLMWLRVGTRGGRF
jgi:hypothetical protein